MRVQASAARESHRHHRGIRRRPAGGERNEARRVTGNKRPTNLFPNQGLRRAMILSRMPHHAGSRRGDADTRPTPLRADRGFEIQSREDEHHAGSSRSKAPVQGRCPQTEVETEEMRVTPYREAVGALMWAATMTCSDVAYAVHQLGKFNDNPGPVNWGAAKRALKYMWRPKDVGITYGGTPGSCT